MSLRVRTLSGLEIENKNLEFEINYLCGELVHGNGFSTIPIFHSSAGVAQGVK